MTEIKPCPFCGFQVSPRDRFNIKCEGCGVEMNAFPHLLIEQWNNRIPNTDDVSMIQTESIKLAILEALEVDPYYYDSPHLLVKFGQKELEKLVGLFSPHISKKCRYCHGSKEEPRMVSIGHGIRGVRTCTNQFHSIKITRNVDFHGAPSFDDLRKVFYEDGYFKASGDDDANALGIKAIHDFFESLDKT